MHERPHNNNTIQQSTGSTKTASGSLTKTLAIPSTGKSSRMLDLNPTILARNSIQYPFVALTGIQQRVILRLSLYRLLYRYNLLLEKALDSYAFVVIFLRME